MLHAFVSTVAFLSLWQGAILLFEPPPYLLPGPLALMRKALFLITEAGFLTHIPHTLAEILFGLVIGIALGIVSAIAFHRFPTIELFCSPIIVFLQTAPKIAIAPLLLLWLGLGLTPKVVLVAIVTFFPILSNMLSALRSIPPSMQELARVLRLTPLQHIRRIELPMSMPMIFAGAKVAVTLAVTAAVIGELMGARAGLGYLLSLGQETSDVELVLVTVFVLSFIGYSLYVGVVVAERRLLRWHESTAELGPLGS